MTENERHQIKARRVKFDWAETPLHWVTDDPFTTHTINVLHLLLPAGERWFCQVFRTSLPLVTDDQLREDAKGFIGQEAIHSRAHAGVLDHLGAQGVDTTAYTRRIDWIFERMLGETPFAVKRFPKALEREWLKQRLAIIAAIEHFTCVLGGWVLEADALDRAESDPTMLDLLRWHGAEEVEHRAVAFDMFSHVSGGYARRVLAMIGVAPVMAWLWYVGTRFLMRRDPSHPPKPRWRDLLRAARRGLLPRPREVGAAIPRYLKPGYHPLQEADTKRALAYLASSPAAKYAS
ncbi:MAG: metal-dependent hydrolase [Acidimicrobiales bacterium]